MCNPTVSVIMPVYGVERYLAKAINSVVNQTFTDWELILVDDKSPDRCPVICDRFAEKDGRIRVIHKPENEGLGFARNTGLDAARGEFIYFMDSDDYLEPGLLKTTVSAMTDETQLVVFGVNREHEAADGTLKKREMLTPEAMKSNSTEDTAKIFIMLNKNKVFPFVWNKLYRKSFLDSCKTRFEQTKLIEDFLFNIDIFSKASGITVIPENLYNYRKPAHETLASSYSPDFFELCKRKYTLEKSYLEAAGAVTEENLQVIYFSHIKHLIALFLKNRSPKAGLSLKEQAEKIRYALDDAVSQEVIKSYKPRGLLMKAVAFLLKLKNPYICIVFTPIAKLISG